MNKLTLWMRAATTAQQTQLAKWAGTSRAYLYVLSNPDSPAKREASPSLAARIEHAAARFKGLPTVLRTDLNSACAGCEYAMRCKRQDKQNG